MTETVIYNPPPPLDLGEKLKVCSNHIIIIIILLYFFGSTTEPETWRAFVTGVLVLCVFLSVNLATKSNKCWFSISDLNQHVYASSSLLNEYQDSDHCTFANDDSSELKVSDLITSTAADNNLYNICEPEGVNNSTYESVSDDEQTTNNNAE